MARTDRIAQLIKKEVSNILAVKLNDPRIGFVSITEVELTPDLKIAKIFVSIFGDESSKTNSIKGLKSAASFVRGELGKRLGLRFVPEISFIRDDSIERGSRIIGIINNLNPEREHVKKRIKKNNKNR